MLLPAGSSIQRPTHPHCWEADRAGAQNDQLGSGLHCPRSSRRQQRRSEARFALGNSQSCQLGSPLSSASQMDSQRVHAIPPLCPLHFLLPHTIPTNLAPLPPTDLNYSSFLISSRPVDVTAPSAQCICANSKSEVHELTEPTEDLVKEVKEPHCCWKISPDYLPAPGPFPSQAEPMGLL